MKHLLFKIKEMIRRFYLHLSVVLTLGIRDVKEGKNQLCHSEDSDKKGKGHEKEF